MPLIVTILIARLAAWLSRVLRRGGGQALPGLIALKLDHGVINKFAARLSDGVIVVTGTNGKTTTTKMIAEALTTERRAVLTNSTGSNLRQGVASAFIQASNWRGQLPATQAVFEIDEASLRQLAPELQPDLIVVLNLFRDQLDRYGELDTLARVIGEGIASTHARLVLNADDPLVASLVRYVAGSTSEAAQRVHYFGMEVDGDLGKTLVTATDSDRCPMCHQRLEFSRVYYGHIGHYRCPTGDFVRPKPTVSVGDVDFTKSGTSYDVLLDKQHIKGKIQLPGAYNLYNALAALSVLSICGLKPERSVAALAHTEAAFGRVERVEVEGRSVCLLLIKNPAGFAQVLSTFLTGEQHPTVLFVINDLDADGRDISWLWDVPLEEFGQYEPACFVAGIRAADMQLRLKYAGMTAEASGSVAQSLSRALNATMKGETLYILPTYTAMLEVRQVLGSSVGTGDIG